MVLQRYEKKLEETKNNSLHQPTRPHPPQRLYGVGAKAFAPLMNDKATFAPTASHKPLSILLAFITEHKAEGIYHHKTKKALFLGREP